MSGSMFGTDRRESLDIMDAMGEAPNHPEADAVTSEATNCLAAVAAGDAVAADRLGTLIYQSLREIAGKYLARHGGRLTLQPTALVHEAYLRLIKHRDEDFAGRTHFLAAAAVAMRHALVDHLRARGRRKRGGDWERVTLTGIGDGGRDLIDVLALDEALHALAKLDARAARVVVLRFFSGMNDDAIADVLHVSARTVRNDWRMARAWLRCALGEADASEEPAP